MTRAAAGGGVLSLRARVVLAAGVVLACFLGLTGLAVERAFHEAGLVAVRDRLQAHVYALLAAAEVDGEGELSMPRALPEARLATPDSGLYARIVAAGAGEQWRSASALGRDVAYPAAPRPGIAAFAALDADAGAGDEGLYALAFPVQWEFADGRSRDLVFQVAESRAILARQLDRFRRSLWSWLAAAGVALVLVQGVVLGFGLRPLGRAAREVAEIEAGGRTRLSAAFPRELRPLTDSVNALIDSAGARVERYRHALGELAHSLKTPLAVLGNALEDEPDAGRLRRTVAEQAARMRATVDYQLQRAAASGRKPLAPWLDPAPAAKRLAESLGKVYADKTLALELDLAAGCRFPGDEGDLVELLGNVMDNACKWARRRVVVHGAEMPGPPPALVLRVDDDGPGIPAERAGAVLARGARGDPATPGHGIGLAVVHELVTRVYGGRVVVSRAELGGARVELHIPLRAP
ncbi:MAG: ATP-binding protein [Gammaproteobacteria bacterium]|nr:ATP-binding protein [Gammaproteobacteria bacterium]